MSTSDAWREGQALPAQTVDEISAWELSIAARTVLSLGALHGPYRAHPIRLPPGVGVDRRPVHLAERCCDRRAAADGARSKTRSLSQAAVDKIYKRLRRNGTITRQANYAIDKVAPGLSSAPPASGPIPHSGYRTRRQDGAARHQSVRRCRARRLRARDSQAGDASTGPRFRSGCEGCRTPRARGRGTHLFRVASATRGRARGALAGRTTAQRTDPTKY